MSTIHWFRKGLRIHDNPALLNAVKEELILLPIYVLNPDMEESTASPVKWQYILESLADLDQSLRSLGSRLLVIKGKPKDVFKTLFETYNIKRLTWEYDYEPNSDEINGIIRGIADENGAEVIVKNTHTLYDSQRILSLNEGEVPLTYSLFKEIISKIGPPDQPVVRLSELPPSCQMNDFIDQKLYTVPTLKDLGVNEDDVRPCVYPGGESEALLQLERHLEQTNSGNVSEDFSSPEWSRNRVLSPYLNNGCLSCRLLYYGLRKNSQENEETFSLPGHLIWREFFYFLGSKIPFFDQMDGNEINRQIPWKKNEKLIQAFREAKTGYPFIDALMVKLSQEGWLSYLQRQVLGCFFTRGDLWQPWEEGKKIFEELMLDADAFSNAGNWLLTSASAFTTQYYIIYSPVTSGKKSDPSGGFIRKYLPILKDFDEEYIYEPWKAPLESQKKSRCVVGFDYPEPVVYHDRVVRVNKNKMSNFYKANRAKKRKEEKNEDENKNKKLKTLI